jgi:prephenate dehydratase
MALGQCQLFLSGLENVVVSEFKDTATSAKLVAADKENKLAVIAGPTVGKTYGLDVVVDNVGDENPNFTRFYILSKGADFDPNPNKGSITLKTHNHVGGLSDILVVLKEANLNLTKIQSVPIPKTPSSYAFHLDIEFDDKKVFDAAINKLSPFVESIKILGVYKGEGLAI